MNEPKDPFEANEVEAKVMFSVMQSYMGAGFRRAEAFQIFMAFLSAGAQDGVSQANGHQ